MTAYDYTRQQWLSGSDAKIERRRQIERELDLLRGERGPAYLRFLGREPGGIAGDIRTLEAELRALSS